MGQLPALIATDICTKTYIIEWYCEPPVYSSWVQTTRQVFDYDHETRVTTRRIFGWISVKPATTRSFQRIENPDELAKKPVRSRATASADSQRSAE